MTMDTGELAQHLQRKLRELEEILEVKLLDIRKDLERLDYLYNTLDTDVYLLKNSVTELENGK